MPGPAGFDPSAQTYVRGSDGVPRIVDNADVGKAIAAGGKPFTPEQTAVAEKQRAQYAEDTSLGGQAETLATGIGAGILDVPASFAGGTGHQALAGLMGAAGASPEQVVASEARDRRMAEANPMLDAMGSTIGNTAFGMLAGGGVGGLAGKGAALLGTDALATSLGQGSGILSRLAGRAVTAAPDLAGSLAENAAFGIGSDNEQAFLQNRNLAADEVTGAGLVGAGLGLGIGAAARGASFLGGKVANAAAERLGNLVGEGGALEGVANKARYADLMQGADKGIFKGADEAALTARQKLEGLTGASAERGAEVSGKRLTELRSKLDEIGAKAAAVDTEALGAKIKAQADEIRSVGTNGSKTLGNSVEKEIAPLLKRASEGESISVPQLMKAQDAIGDTASRLSADSARRVELEKLHATIGESIKEAIAKTDPALAEEWGATKSAHSEVGTINKAYESKLANAPKSSGLGFGDQQLSMQGMLGGILMGHAAIPAAIGGLALGIGKKLARENAAGFIAKTADALASRGEIPSVTKLLAASSQARQQLGHYAVAQMVQKGTKAAMSEAIEHPAGFAYGATAHYESPKNVATQYQAAQNALQSTDGDIQGMAQRANQQLGALAHEQPELAAAAQMRMAKAIDWLRSQQPVSPPQSVLSQQFGTSSKNLPPTADQISFLKKFRASVDPSVIYGEIARGYVQPETVETLENLYPDYLASVRMGVLQSIQSNPDTVNKLDYSQRIALDNLMGGDGQVEPTRRFTVQDRLSQANDAAMKNEAPLPPSARKTPNIAHLDDTPSDRLMST